MNSDFEMNELSPEPRIYDEFTSWWPLLSDPADYAEEASFYRRALISACASRPKTLLELGSGGGNNASFLKRHFKMTLVDRSSNMLAVSQALNPRCEHIQDDMRTARLRREFDAVFIHDAIMYMATEEDLQRAIETAFIHCKPGGAALFAPDCVRESFHPSTKHGGHDSANRAFDTWSGRGTRTLQTLLTWLILHFFFGVKMERYGVNSTRTLRER